MSMRATELIIVLAKMIIGFNHFVIDQAYFPIYILCQSQARNNTCVALLDILINGWKKLHQCVSFISTWSTALRLFLFFKKVKGTCAVTIHQPKWNKDTSRWLIRGHADVFTAHCHWWDTCQRTPDKIQYTFTLYKHTYSNKFLQVLYINFWQSSHYATLLYCTLIPWDKLKFWQCEKSVTQCE